jgi:hypothetical protein
MKKKSYKLTFSFDAGYSGDGKVFSSPDIESTIENWLVERIQDNKLTINGFLQTGKLFYPSRGRRGDGELVTVAPSATYEGEITRPEDVDRDEAEVKEALESLAYRIKERLCQERVYIVFNDEHWFI